MKKIAWIGLLVLLVCLAGGALASGAQELHIQNVAMDAHNDLLEAVVYTTVEGNLSPKDFQVKIGAAEAPVTEVSAYNRTQGYTTSYLLVVDTDPLTQTGFTIMKNVLTAFVGQIGEGDNVGVMRVGEEPNLSDDRNLVVNAINNLPKANNTKTLNATIVSAISYLDTSTKANMRKVLIVVSTGGKRNETDVDQAGLLYRYGEAKNPITVYTLALMTSNTRVAEAGAFGEIAGRSKGGIEIVANNSTPAEEILGRITNNEHRVVVLSIDPETATGTELSVSIESGDSRLSDRQALSPEVQQALEDRLAAITGVVVVPVTPVVAPGSDDPDDPIDPADGPTETSGPIPPNPNVLFTIFGIDVTLEILMLFCASLVLIALLVVLLLVTRGKKKRAEDKHGTSPADDDMDGEVTEPISGPVVAGNTYVTFTPVGKSSMEPTSCYIADKLIIGRNPSMVQLVIKDDAKVSGRHAMITYASGVLRIEDLGSTNGTRVNDRDVKAPVALQENDIVTVGRTSLRIRWRER